MTEIILQPTGDQVRAFRDRTTGEPISMLNLLKFRKKAVYEDGRESELSGEQAYHLYGKAFREIMEPQGARVVYSGEVRGFLIGVKSSRDGPLPGRRLGIRDFRDARSRRRGSVGGCRRPRFVGSQRGGARA